MKIRIDYDLCEGNAVCMKVAPEVFVVGEDDRARLVNPNPSEELRAKVELAVKRCPRQALSLVE
ncbi:Ferredoxin [bacterium HR30]|nr:Ferredoxin [bacterium HR30]